MQDKRKDEEFEIDLKELIGAILSKAWLVILCTLILGIAGFVVSSYVMTPKYESTTKVYILNKASDKVTVNDTQLASQLTKDYEQLIKSRTVLEQVMKNCEIEDESYETFAGRIAIQTVVDTRIISITVTDTDPQMAQKLANGIREEAAVHIKNVTDVEAVNVADEANLPMNPSSPSVVKYSALGAFIGMFLSMGAVVVAFLMDDTIKTSEDIEKYLGLSTLAMIPNEDIERKSESRKKSKRTQKESRGNKEVEELLKSRRRGLKTGEYLEVVKADGTEG